MLMDDGVVPGNEGRGYVLRRLLRRSVRSMRLMGVQDASLIPLLETSYDAMRASYPGLDTTFPRIRDLGGAEEDAFSRTLTAGTTIFDTAASSTKSAGGKVIGGKAAFTLHDTYGFPIDLTLEMASEQGLSVDETAFRALMQEQKDRARADAKAKKGGHGDTSAYQAVGASTPSVFRGYEELQAASKVVAILKDGVSVPAATAGETVEVMLAETPFYPESGGQDADRGEIRGANATLEVVDVQRPVKDVIVHTARVEEGTIAVGDAVSAEVDAVNRRNASKAHSATHLIHAALHEVLGKQANQAGSYNKPGYMRLDFAWTQGVSTSARGEIEAIANNAIREDLPVDTTIMSLDEAKSLGAMALFGEKYGDRVRVVEIGGPFSRELCAGTHVGNSSQIGLLTVMSEGSVGSGARRIEAFVGADAFSHLAAERAIVNELTTSLKTQPHDLTARVGALVERLSQAEKELASMRQQSLLATAGSVAEAFELVKDTRLVTVAVADAASADDLRTLALDVRARLGDSSPAVVALFAAIDGRPAVVVATNEPARAKGLRAGDLVKAASTALGGGGGGKPDLAQGGGTDTSAIPAARAAVMDLVASRD